MPTRKRIRTINPTVQGGGGGSPATGLVQWGPDFGGDAGADGLTFNNVSAAVDLEALGIVGDLAVSAAVDLDRLELRYIDAFGVAQAIDLASLGIDGDLAVDVAVDLDRIRMEAGLGVASAVDLDSIAMQGDLGVSAAVSGLFKGPPIWIDVETNTGNAGLGGGNVSVNVPTHVEGDLLLVDAAANGLNGDITAVASGWTVIHTVPNLNNNRARFFYRFAGASEPASYAFNFPAGVATNPQVVLGMHSYRGVDPATPVDDSQHTSANSTGTTVAVPSATSTVANTMRHVFGYVHNTLNATQTNYSFTPAASFSEEYDIGNNPVVVPVNDSAMAWRILAAVGASGAANWTISPNPSLAAVNKIGVQILLRPDPAGVPL